MTNVQHAAPRRNPEPATRPVHAQPSPGLYTAPAVRLVHRLTGRPLPTCQLLAAVAGYVVEG